MSFSKIILGNCEIEMNRIKDNSMDLILTSPPFDGVNMPKGWAVDFRVIGMHFERVLKPGGVCCLLTQDLIKNGRKSGTSFHIAHTWPKTTTLHFWADYIYYRGGMDGYWWKRRLRIDHDYVFIFVNEKTQPNTFSKTHMGTQGTVLDYRKEKKATRKPHPKFPGIPFPNKFASDMIQMFTVKDDAICDPFCGTGTTLIEAARLQRCSIGIELLDEVYQYANTQVTQSKIGLF